MASAEFTAGVAAFATRPFDLVRVTFENAVGGGTTVFVFCDATAPFPNLRLDANCLPLLTRLGGVSVELTPGGVGTRRGIRQVSFRDWADYPHSLGAGALATSGGSFFERLQVAFPAWHRAKVEYLYAFEDAAFDAVAKAEPMFVGVLEEWGFPGDHEVTWTVADAFALKGTQAPVPVSDANVLTAGINATAALIPVAAPSEFPDPSADWPSPDWLAPTVEVDYDGASRERIAYGSKVAGGLVVAANWLPDAEDLTTANWAVTVGSWTRTAAAAPGPFGPSNGCLLESTAAAAELTANTALVSSGQAACASLWLREHPSYPGQTVYLGLDDGFGTTFWATCVLEPYWRRFSAAGTLPAIAGTCRLRLWVWGGVAQFYAAQAQLDSAGIARRPWVRGQAAGASAGRGFHGLAATSHSLGAKVRDVWACRRDDGTTDANAEGWHPVWVAAELLNRAYCPLPTAGDVRAHLPAFQREADYLALSRVRRVLLDPQAVPELLGRACEQYLMEVWVARTGTFAARLAWRPRGLAASDLVLSREHDILESGPGRGTFRLDSNKGSRVNVLYVHWGLKRDASGLEERGDRAEDFDHHEVWLEADPALVGSDFRSLQARTIYADFHYRAADAVALGGRLLGRFRAGARKAEGVVSFRRFLEIEAGDVVKVDHPRLRTAVAGVATRAPVSFQVVSAEYGPRAADPKLKLLEATRRRAAHITPTAFPDYPDPTVTDAERDFYGWIGDTNNKVNGGTEDGYYIS